VPPDSPGEQLLEPLLPPALLRVTPHLEHVKLLVLQSLLHLLLDMTRWHNEFTGMSITYAMVRKHSRLFLDNAEEWGIEWGVDR
jgi:hypothetical protein